MNIAQLAAILTVILGAVAQSPDPAINTPVGVIQCGIVRAESLPYNLVSYSHPIRVSVDSDHFFGLVTSIYRHSGTRRAGECCPSRSHRDHQRKRVRELLWLMITTKKLTIPCAYRLIWDVDIPAGTSCTLIIRDALGRTNPSGAAPSHRL